MTATEKEFYIYDSEGEWSEEGLAHEAISLDKNYDEKKFFDTLRPYDK